MQPAAPDYSRKWYVMAAVAMGLFLATIDGSIVNVALPVLQSELHADFSVIQWVVLAYLLVVVTLMLSVGRLADMIGKKPLYLVGFIIFTAGSVLCGLSSSAGMLILFRVLQAVGAVMLMALGTAIVTEAFPPSERGRALGMGGLMVSIGSISGPTLGGLILGVLSWHWIFFVNLPVGVVGALMVWRFVPAHKPVGAQRFDFPGAASLFVSLLALLMALTLGQNIGFMQAVVWALFALSAACLALFVRIEIRSPQPMIDLRLFQNNLFSVNLITGSITFISSAGTVLLMPFFLQNVLNYSPEKAGLLLVTVPLAMGIVAPLSGALSDRFGTRPLTVIGLGLLLLGYAGVTTLNVDTTPLGYILRFIPIGVGMGVFQSPNNSAVMGAAPHGRLGVVSGLLSLTRTLGQTAGIAIMGALWATQVKASAAVLGGWQGDATLAPAAAQVTALHGTILVIVGLIFMGFLLSITAWWLESRVKPAVAPQLDLESRAAEQIVETMERVLPE